MLLVHRMAKLGCKPVTRQDLFTEEQARVQGGASRQMRPHIPRRGPDAEILAALAAFKRNNPHFLGFDQGSLTDNEQANKLRNMCDMIDNTPSDIEMGYKQIGIGPTELRAYDVRPLLSLPNFRVDNVANFVALTGARGDEARQLTGIAPPFEEFVVEYQLEPRNFGRIQFLHRSAAERFSSTTREELKELYPDALVPAEGRFFLRWDLIVESRRDRFVHVAHGALTLDGLGDILEARQYPATPDLPSTVDGDRGHPHEITSAFSSFPALFSLSLIACTNVPIRHVQGPSLKPKRGQPVLPRESYHVIDVGPITEALRRSADLGTEGLGVALQRSRGHFKTYGPDGPLFGKYVGKWYWGPRVHGDESNGVITRDYTVSRTSTEIVRPAQSGQTQSTEPLLG